MNKLLAVDYGTKRVGLAITDEDGHFAFNHKILYVKNDADAIRQLLAEIEKENIQKVIFGMPLLLDGSNSTISFQIQIFIEELKRHTDVEIDSWNEFMTSKLAEETAKHVQYKRKMIDSEAARIVLQEYIDYHETINTN